MRLRARGIYCESLTPVEMTRKNDIVISKLPDGTHGLPGILAD
jgi:hypothetical protein